VSNIPTVPVLPSRGGVDFLCEAVYITLKLVKESSAAFPPLQSVAGGLVSFLELCRTMADNEDLRSRVLDRVESIEQSLIAALPEADAHQLRQEDLTPVQLAALIKFALDIDKIINDLLEEDTKRKWRTLLPRLVTANKRKSKLESSLIRLEDAAKDFRFTISFHTDQIVVRTQRLVEHNIVPGVLRLEDSIKSTNAQINLINIRIMAVLF